MPMMRSLTIKWIATLMLTSMIGVVLVGFFASRSTMFEYDRLRIERAEVAFVDNMAVYYKEHGSWAGLADPTVARKWQVSIPGITADPITVYGPQPALPASGVTQADGVMNTVMIRTEGVPPPLFAIANTDQVVVSGFGPFQIGERVTAPLIEDGVPITVNGRRVGTALLAERPSGLSPWEQRYIDNTNRALIAAAVGSGLISLVIGGLLSRGFLRPLGELTQAITAVQQGHLAQQVPVRTNDELGTLARAFNHMSSELHRANQLRIQMTADIAHDLRTPLMVISGYLEALRDGILAPTVERFDAMNQETVLLKRLIEDLRTLSLADAGELKLLTQPIPPQEMLEQVKEAFKPLADDAGVTLKIIPPSDPLPSVSVDRARMVQVLGNLVSNALRYTEPEGQITLAARAVEDQIQLVVADTGAGIDADKLPNIFERFYRADNSRTQTHGESGLGLAIAKAIVEAHRGTITVTSHVGVGTEMTIQLPMAA